MKRTIQIIVKILIIFALIFIIDYVKNNQNNIPSQTSGESGELIMEEQVVEPDLLKESGINEKSIKLINDIVQADINNGFPGAQIAIMKDGKLVYKNSWGYKNAYNPDGSPIDNPEKITDDTLFDLASNTKMYSVAYAIQHLVENDKLNLEDKIVDIIGNEFVDNTLEIKFASYEDNYPGFSKIKEWKRNITIKDVMMHRAGFPDSGHYHNQKYDQIHQKLVDDVDNLLYVENASKEKTLLEGICKTPLICEPQTKTMYSDIDYMLLGIIVEKITNTDLNTFLKETFWNPMGLTHITYSPLQNGFTKDDCAATELIGNTRAGLVDFPRVRHYTIQGEVHDEECYYLMDGVSGHAGLFSNAEDLAKLASLMLTGEYNGKHYFNKETISLFTSPQLDDNVNYGIGWWRNGNHKRTYYFGDEAPETNIGHQGWTGTLTMIDYENNMVVVFLTNSKNTPIIDATSLDNANNFAGNYYTTSSLGFVNDILYLGIYHNEDIDDRIKNFVADLIESKQNSIKKQEEKIGHELDKNHPLLKAKKALDEVYNLY